MKILGILTLSDTGKFIIYPLEGLSISESYPTTTSPANAIPNVKQQGREVSGSIVTPPTPEQDKISKEVEAPKNIDEVLNKIKAKEDGKKWKPDVSEMPEV